MTIGIISLDLHLHRTAIANTVQSINEVKYTHISDLILKAPIATAADDSVEYFFIVFLGVFFFFFQRKQELIFHVKPLQ